MFSILGLTWHIYGLILGLAVVIGWWLTILKAQQHQINIKFLESQLLWIILGGVVGARLYHVITDWPLYAQNPFNALYIWRGGLGIVGAVIGGAAVLLLNAWRSKKISDLGIYLDLLAFVLPVSQAIGRLGNYVNQELYGKPSQLPWAIYIDPVHRLPGYGQVATYHPLFAYEMIGLGLFALAIWWLDKKWPWKLGQGKLFAGYVAYYAVLRFSLDFLRLDTRRVDSGLVTLNQLVMIVIFMLAVGYILKKSYAKFNQST